MGAEEESKPASQAEVTKKNAPFCIYESLKVNLRKNDNGVAEPSRTEWVGLTPMLPDNRLGDESFGQEEYQSLFSL